LVEEIGILPDKYHQPVTSHWKTLSRNIVLLEQVIFLWPRITFYRLSWLFQISNVWLSLKLFTSIYLWFEIFNLKYINESYFYKTTGRGSIIIKLHVKHEHPGITYMHSGYMCKITDNIWKIYFFSMFLRCRDNVLLSTCPFSIFRFHVLVVFIYIYIYIYIVKGLFGFYFGICKDANLLFCFLALIRLKVKHYLHTWGTLKKNIFSRYYQ
jgi:hypothetical protein